MGIWLGGFGLVSVSVHVCMCVHMYVCMCVCVYVCVVVCVIDYNFGPTVSGYPYLPNVNTQLSIE